MKDKKYRLELLKKQLQTDEAKGIKVREWQLSREQYEYVKGLGYKVEAILYSFKTRQFQNIRSKPALIKEIHYASKRGKWMMKKRLNKSEMQILKEYNIKFKPVVFKIYLRT